MSTNAELARNLFDALERGDNDTARALCAADCQVSQNGGEPMGIDAMLAFSGAIGRVVSNRRYENIVTQETADGFVEEHDFAATLADGADIRMTACVVATVTDGKMTSMREYVDTRAAGKLFAALQAARGD